MNIRTFFWAYIDLWVESNKGSDITTYNQCVDAWRVYNRQVIKAPDIFGNPPDLWEKYQSDYYDKIPNTPTGVPQLGDVIIWGTKYGKYGHIAICTEIANTKTFTSFDQNDPIGEPCHFQPHTYAGVLGWLRPKNQLVLQPPEEVSNAQDKISDLEIKVKSLNEQVAKTQLENSELRTTLENQERDNTDLTTQLIEARRQRDEATRQVKELEGRAEELQRGLDSLVEENKGLKSSLEGSKTQILEAINPWEHLEWAIKKFLGKK